MSETSALALYLRFCIAKKQSSFNLQLPAAARWSRSIDSGRLGVADVTFKSRDGFAVTHAHSCGFTLVTSESHELIPSLPFSSTSQLSMTFEPGSSFIWSRLYAVGHSATYQKSPFFTQFSLRLSDEFVRLFAEIYYNCLS